MSRLSKIFTSESPLSREKILLLLTLVILTAALLAIASHIINTYISANQKIDEITPRYQRLEGSWQAREEMQEVMEHSTKLLNAYVYPIEKDTSTVGTETQQKLRNAFSSAGLTLSSSQTLQEREEGSLQAIPVTIRATGSIENLKNALAQVSGLTPVIRLESLNLQQGRKLNQYSAITLNIQATFIVLRRPA